MNTPSTTTETAADRVTLADIHDSVGKNPDTTGDFAAGRTTFFENDEEFLAALNAQPYDHNRDPHESPAGCNTRSDSQPDG